MMLLFIRLQSAAAQENALEYIVTAGRLPEDPANVPAMVRVVTAEDIETSGAGSVAEALELLAGIPFRRISGDAQAEIAMRGFGESSFGRVLVLVDGHRLNNPDMQGINWATISLSDIDRIEVLHGASGVRYGDSAVAGVVNIITRAPESGLSLRGGISGGSFGSGAQRALIASGGRPGGVSASAGHTSTKGYRQRSATETWDAALRGYLDISDRFSLEASGAFSRTEYQMPGGLTTEQYATDRRMSVTPFDEARESSVHGRLRLFAQPTDRIGIEAPFSIVKKWIGTDMASWWSFTDRHVEILEAKPSVRIDIPRAGGGTRIVAGVDVTAAALDVRAFASGAREVRTNAFTVSRLAVGPFGTAKIDFGPAVSVEAGVRYDTGTNAAQDESGSFDRSKRHAVLVYDAGVVVRPTKWLKTFARYGTLFRYPFTDEQASTYMPPFGFNDGLEAETGRNFELGSSVRIRELLAFEAILYSLSMEDEIAFDATTFTNVNMNSTRRIGADLNLSAKPLPFLTLGGTYGFVSAFFSSGPDAGKRVPLVPFHTGTFRLAVRPLVGLEAGASGRFRGPSFQGGDTPNMQPPVPGFAVFGLSASYGFERGRTKLRFTGTVDNVFDRAYATQAYHSAWSGSSAWYPAPGRSFNLNLAIGY